MFPDADTISAVAELGPLGVLALFIVVVGALGWGLLNLVRHQVIPLVTNHVEHMETAYAKMADAMTEHNTLTRSMRATTRNTLLILETQTALLRELKENTIDA